MNTALQIVDSGSLHTINTTINTEAPDKCLLGRRRVCLASAAIALLMALVGVAAYVVLQPDIPCPESSAGRLMSYSRFRVGPPKNLASDYGPWGEEPLPEEVNLSEFNKLQPCHMKSWSADFFFSINVKGNWDELDLKKLGIVDGGIQTKIVSTISIIYNMHKGIVDGQKDVNTLFDKLRDVLKKVKQLSLKVEVEPNVFRVSFYDAKGSEEPIAYFGSLPL